MSHAVNSDLKFPTCSRRSSSDCTTTGITPSSWPGASLETKGKTLDSQSVQPGPEEEVEESDLKNMYVTRKALQSKLKAPIMTQEQLLLRRASKCTMGDANNAGPMRSCSSNTFH